MSSSTSTAATGLVTYFLVPILSHFAGVTLSDKEQGEIAVGATVLAHWVATTPVLAPVRSWWGGKREREFTPQQMSAVVQEVSKLAVPVVLAKVQRNLEQ